MSVFCAPRRGQLVAAFGRECGAFLAQTPRSWTGAAHMAKASAKICMAPPGLTHRRCASHRRQVGTLTSLKTIENSFGKGIVSELLLHTLATTHTARTKKTAVGIAGRCWHWRRGAGEATRREGRHQSQCRRCRGAAAGEVLDGRASQQVLLGASKCPIQITHSIYTLPSERTLARYGLWSVSTGVARRFKVSR
jgi:hypothetical protein